MVKDNIRAFKASLRSQARNLVPFIRHRMRFPTYPAKVRQNVETIADDVRYATLALAIQRCQTAGIEGAFAELGVYRGVTSKFIHEAAPDRTLYLFDTFEGFPESDLEVARDDRFKDTSHLEVARFIADLNNVVFRIGYFPQTAEGLEDEKFALVMLDFDLYQPALDAFQFFYPRLASGGYFILHDYNSPESAGAIRRAATEYLRDKPEHLIEIPDEWGSALFRKI